MSEFRPVLYDTLLEERHQSQSIPLVYPCLSQPEAMHAMQEERWRIIKVGEKEGNIFLVLGQILSLSLTFIIG